MKKTIGWILIILGGYLCIGSIICILGVFIEGKVAMNQTYIRNPAASCAEYLRHHSGSDLIDLLKEYQLIENVLNF